MIDLTFGLLFSSSFVFPGIAFRMAYQKNDPYQYTISKPYITEALFVILISSLLHVMSLIALDTFALCDIETILHMFIAPSKVLESHPERSVLFLLFIYILGLTILGIFLGWGFQSLVLKFKMDLKLQILKVSNEWWYLFEGRDDTGENLLFDLIKLDILMEGKDGDYIYSGVLEDFFMRDGKLDKLHLSFVFRCKFKAEASSSTEQKQSSDILLRPSDVMLDQEQRIYLRYKEQFDDRFTRVEGTFVVINYKLVKNISVHYLKIMDYNDIKTYIDTGDIKAAIKELNRWTFDDKGKDKLKKIGTKWKNIPQSDQKSNNQEQEEEVRHELTILLEYIFAKFEDIKVWIADDDFRLATDVMKILATELDDIDAIENIMKARIKLGQKPEQDDIRSMVFGVGMNMLTLDLIEVLNRVHPSAPSSMPISPAPISAPAVKKLLLKADLERAFDALAPILNAKKHPQKRNIQQLMSRYYSSKDRETRYGDTDAHEVTKQEIIDQLQAILKKIDSGLGA